MFADTAKFGQKKETQWERKTVLESSTSSSETAGDARTPAEPPADEATEGATLAVLARMPNTAVVQTTVAPQRVLVHREEGADANTESDTNWDWSQLTSPIFHNIIDAWKT